MADKQLCIRDPACRICNSFFSLTHVPKTLPECSHIFCIICLTEIAEEDLYLPPGKVNCPDCHSLINVPEGGIVDLDTDFELLKLAEMQNERCCNLPVSNETVDATLVTRTKETSRLTMLTENQNETNEEQWEHGIRNKDKYPKTQNLDASFQKHAGLSDKEHEKISFTYEESHFNYYDDDAEKTDIGACNMDNNNNSASCNKSSSKQNTRDTSTDTVISDISGIYQRTEHELDKNTTKRNNVPTATPRKSLESKGVGNNPLFENRKEDTCKKTPVPKPRKSLGQEKSGIVGPNFSKPEEVSLELNNNGAEFSGCNLTTLSPNDGKTDDVLKKSDTLVNEMTPDKHVLQADIVPATQPSENSGQLTVATSDNNIPINEPLSPTPDCDVQKGKSLSGDQNKTCQIHSDSEVIYFCWSCKVLLCPRCLISGHLQHDIKTLAKALSWCHHEIQRKLLTTKSKCKETFNKLTDLETSFQIALDEEYQRIDSSVERNTNYIRNEGKRHSDEIRVAVTVQRQRQHQINSESKSDIMSSQSSDVYKASGGSRSSSGYKTQLMHRQLYKSPIASISFEEHSYALLWEEAHSIGNFVSCLELRMIQEITDFGLVNTIACTENGALFVGDVQRKKIKIYQRSNGIFIVKKVLSCPVISVKEMKNNKCLAATVGEGIQIFSGDGDKISQFAGNEVKHLTISPNGNVFGSSLKGAQITEFDPCGMQTKIYTSKTGPLRFDFIDTDTIAVGYKHVPGVDIISYSQMRMSGRLNIKRKIHVDVALGLCFDPISKCLLVGKCKRSDKKRGYFMINSGVIEQYFIETGDCVARLVTGLCAPFCLTFVSDSLVAVADGESVKLYSLKRSAPLS